MNGDTATVIYIAEGNPQGQLHPWNAPATRKLTPWEEISDVRVACGKIVDVWNQVNYVPLLNNLGIVTDEEMSISELPPLPAP